jgi:hypothetical protein
MALPTDGPEPDRYRGRPLLILLENYVLAAISVIDPETHRTLTAAVQRVYGGGDDWWATLRSVLQLPDRFDGDIREMWDKNKDLAHIDGKLITPVQFAKLFVDSNFPIDASEP